VCSGDETLRTEVESLITSDRGGLSFIDEPAFEMAARLLATMNLHWPPEIVSIVTTFSRYSAQAAWAKFIWLTTKS